MTIVKNDIVLVTDGDYKGRLFIVKKSYLSNSLICCECEDMERNNIYHFDNLCCVVIGIIKTDFVSLSYYLSE